MADDPVPPAVPDEAVAAAQRADVEWMRRPPRPVTWQSISDARVRVMLEAAAPHIAAPRLTSAECDRLYRMLAEFDGALGAVRRALEVAAPLDDGDREVIAAAWAALKVLEGCEERTSDG